MSQGVGVISVSCGSSHSAAVVANGEADSIVFTWGRGEDGQLGLGDATEHATPQVVQYLLKQGVSSIHCGAEYTVCYSKSRRQVWSWGWADFGRLGHGDLGDVFVPRPISFFAGMPVAEVACGDTHTLVLTESGELYAFGRNQAGQLGLGHSEDQLTPQLVGALSGQRVASIACGAEHSVASTSTGQVYAWGWGRYGNLGDGHRDDRLLPTRVCGLEGAVAARVNCGWRHSVVVTDAGLLYSFGWSKYGQLGHGDMTDRLTPTLVEALRGRVVVSVAGGWRHTVAVDSEGVLYGWGWNKFGQLGLGDTNDRCSPTVVSIPPATTTSAAAAASDGSAAAGASSAAPKVTLLASGWRHTLAATADGAVYAWGRGVNGQLGIGEEEDRCHPAELTSLCAGHADMAALLARATAAAAACSPGRGYVAPADRYAVVPGAGGAMAGFPSSGDDGDAVVPDVVMVDGVVVPDRPAMPPPPPRQPHSAPNGDQHGVAKKTRL
uniref:RCC1-like domain-containing protein n=1 Tax=Chlamydomonas leiostraca TaxID=1034604 RepID=A0A7S0RRV6_9CHLO|mmetsp:Transcript_29924/g.76218  ORF Transcript_29924/g.76218 Transcript_29924/m.76218 type:complete len:494 (+) Transcript_29924:172-1653(+)